jgi:hypothetical protein
MVVGTFADFKSWFDQQLTWLLLEALVGIGLGLLHSASDV